MKRISFNVKRICLAGILLLYVQNLVFAVGWLKWYYSCAFLTWGGVILYKLFKDQTWMEENRFLTIEKKALILLFLGTALLVWLSGIGGYFPQAYDHIIRNPIFRDLIFEQWPVFYADMNASLNYYFGFWLLPALFGKVLNFLGIMPNVVWEIANILLLCQSVCYLMLTYMLVLSSLRKIASYKNVIRLLITFAAFGGISILGWKITECLGLHNGPVSFEGLSIEHYSHIGVLNNFFLMLASVFNQMLPALLCSAIFFVTKKRTIFGCLLALILQSAPYPAVGMFAIMFLYCAVDMVRERKIFLKEIFSIYNVWAIVWLGVICLFYQGNTKAGIQLNRFWLQYDSFIKLGIAVIVYHVCMWLCYYILAYRQSFERRILNSVFICLAVFPFGLGDFNMRASIAPMFLLFIEVYRQIEEKKARSVFFIQILTLAAVSPLFFLADLSQNVHVNRTFIQRMDPYGSLKNLQESDLPILCQYVKYHPQKYAFQHILGKNMDGIGTYPVVGYGLNQEGKRYIQRVTLPNKESREIFMNDVAAANKEEVEAYFLENPQKEYYQFQDNSIFAAQRQMLNTRQASVTMTWNNYQEKMRSDASAWMLDLTIRNIGSQHILAGQAEEAYQSGVVVSLYDQNKNMLNDVWGYQYINQTIFAGDSKGMTIRLQKPDAGDYYVKIDYFCDGANGESIREYCEPQYYSMKVYENRSFK